VFTKLSSRAATAAIIAAAVMLVLFGCAKKKGETEQTTPKQAGTPPNVTITNYTPAPDVELTALDGTKTQLASMRGNIVVICFLATWNKECAGQVSALNELQDKVQRFQFPVLGVFTDKNGAAVVQDYVVKNAIRFRVYVDGDSVAKRFGGLPRLPTTYILLKDGNIYDREVGPRSMQEIDDKIKEIMSQRL
jgi:peroxiredoxin